VSCPASTCAHRREHHEKTQDGLWICSAPACPCWSRVPEGPPAWPQRPQEPKRAPSRTQTSRAVGKTSPGAKASEIDDLW